MHGEGRDGRGMIRTGIGVALWFNGDLRKWEEGLLAAAENFDDNGHHHCRQLLYLPAQLVHLRAACQEPPVLLSSPNTHFTKPVPKERDPQSMGRVRRTIKSPNWA